ncbi:uncharacterized protein LOC117107144 [Anneissia japonica]|uniref:uncharacterized protein LOC117107144 n=1 Tax=Anneissia japonica TaxID=1529436 RepID=UPI00142563B5|nr:uncharacterized protein LOC117107144 [Anneissia japonica]
MASTGETDTLLRHRSTGSDQKQDTVSWTDSEGDSDYDDPDLPYGGKVYLARKKKPDTLLVRFIEASVVIGLVLFIYYAYYHFENLRFNVNHAYAHIGHTHAMHLVGQRYLNGFGVDKDHQQAMRWFRYAADRDHPHAAHNLAVAHLQGYPTDVKSREEAKKLLKFAADKGVKESKDALRKMCRHGDC